MPHTLLLAEPRGFCAGVVRAIDVLDRVLDVEPPPVYAFHEIVHNSYVVDRFRERGAIFVDAIEDVPEGARIVFSAHGVSPAVVREAERRRLRVIDATCPLVTKVHLETKKAARDGYDILLVGHRGHDEIEGTAGEAPERTVVVEAPQDVAALPRRGVQCSSSRRRRSPSTTRRTPSARSAPATRRPRSATTSATRRRTARRR